MSKARVISVIIGAVAVMILKLALKISIQKRTNSALRCCAKFPVSRASGDCREWLLEIEDDHPQGTEKKFFFCRFRFLYPFLREERERSVDSCCQSAITKVPARVNFFSKNQNTYNSPA